MFSFRTITRIATLNDTTRISISHSVAAADRVPILLHTLRAIVTHSFFSLQVEASKRRAEKKDEHNKLSLGCNLSS